MAGEHPGRQTFVQALKAPISSLLRSTDRGSDLDDDRNSGSRLTAEDSRFLSPSVTSSALAEELASVKSNLNRMNETGQRRDSAIGRVLEVLEEHKTLLGRLAEEESSFNRKVKLAAVGEDDENSAPSPDAASSGSG